MKKLLITVFLTVTIYSNGISQNVVNIDSLEASHPPGKAALRSAVIPGWGQAYNKKFWKIPIIYAGIGTLAYYVNFNNEEYQRFSTAYKLRADGDPSTIDEFADTGLQEADLKTQKDYWHRNRDLCIIGIGAVYILNIIDAYVDAHLFYFKISENISMQWMPSPIYATRKAFSGVNVQLTF